MLLIDLHGDIHVPSLQLLAHAAVPKAQIHHLPSTLKNGTQYVKNVVERGVLG